jgi:hypothetical protein
MLTLKERMDCGGNLTVVEVRALKNIGVAKFYDDVKAGRCRIKKIGRKSVVTAEIAKAYIAGKPLPEEAA